MHTITRITLNPRTREEQFPEFSKDFPYLGTRAYPGRYHIPWHWHPTLELFYMERGALDYYTPHGRFHFPQGSGGLINPGVLHRTELASSDTDPVQLLHLFAPTFLASSPTSRIYQRYVNPVLTDISRPIRLFSPQDPTCQSLLFHLKDSFTHTEGDFGYELHLHHALSTIWLLMLALPQPKALRPIPDDEPLKAMLAFILNQFNRSIRVAEIAAAACISPRVCYRLFAELLHCSPMDYLRDIRLQHACHLLVNSNQTITTIAYDCGFGNSSLFGQSFHQAFNITPTAYRRRWQNSDK